MQIEGVRLILRDWQPADLDTFAHWQQPGHCWQDLDGPYYPKPKAEDIPEIVAKIRGWMETDAWPTPRTRLNIVDKASNQLLGQVSRYWESEETNWLSLGIVIYDPANWGRGLGFEALGLWCDYLWQAMPELVRLGLGTWSGNQGMMYLAEKIGFKEEARRRMARIVKGEYFDSMGYGMLRTEWQQRYPQGFLRHLATISRNPNAKLPPKTMLPNEKTAIYRQQIALAEPNLPIETVEFNQEGLVNDVLIVNGRRVFRFPKHDWAIDHLWQESSCLALARQHVTLPLPRWTIYGAELPGIPFVGYDWIPGEALTNHTLLHLDQANRQAVAEQLGGFLSQMHAIPMSQVKQAMIKPSVTNRTQEAWQTLFNEVKDRLFPYLMTFARDWVENLFAPVLANPNFMAYDPVFMNGDLGPYHLLYNKKTRRLNGVIDFGTAGVGDPATDFACLINQFGESFVRLMAPAYPDIGRHIERARFIAGTLELQWLLGGLRYPDEPDWFMVHLGRARDALPIGSGW